MSSRRLAAAVVSVAFLLSISCLSLHAQSTYGSVAGTVLDPSGAAIPDANVTLTNTGTAEKHTQSTNGDGLFTFVNLFPGEYRVDVEKQGFKHFARFPVTVQVQQDTHIEASMQVGEVSQVVEVTSETPLLQAETSSLGQVVEQRKANELPLNGRNIFNLITVSPGAVAQGGSGGSPVGQNPFSWGNYQIGGSFANQGAEYLDGQPLNIGYINLPILIPTQDSVGEFKVQYSNLGAEWGKFSGGVVNLSTKSGTNNWHGSGYEYFRNKVLNANEYFNKASQITNGTANTPPPWTQNQYGFQVGGPVVKDKTFFYVSWEQYRQRTGSPFTTTVPQPAMLTGDFSSLCTLPVSQGGAGGTFNGAGICSNPVGQLYDPYASTTGDRTANPYPNNQIPSAEFSTATQVLWKTYFPAPNAAGDVNNFISAAPAGGNTNEFVARGDQNIGSNTHVFGRFAYYGLTDLPVNPFGTGLCLDRCAEKYHSKLVAIGVNHTFTPTTVLDVNFAASRFVYGRNPILSGFDLTTLGWPSTYNTPGDSMRTPPTPAFPFPNDVGKSQGNSAIGDHNTQYNVTPAFTLIRGKHTIQAGAQIEWGLDNYFQTNIASGAFAFGGNWTTQFAAGASAAGTACSSTSGNPLLCSNTNFAFPDFLLGLSQNEGSFVNQTEGVAQVPAQTKGSQVYRALFVDDTWHLTPKLTINLGLRYELQGTWSDAYGRLSYWDPLATNATATGCGGTVGSSCPGDAFLVGTGRNHSDNNIPMDKKAFSPRLGFAYSLDSKTVIRGGYGIFYIPNYVSFGLNPDNDFVNLASTPLHATNDSFITPAAMLDGDNCSYGAATSVFPVRGPQNFGCAQSGPFGNSGILPPPGRNFAPLAGTLAPFAANISSFALFTGSPNLAPYYGSSGNGNPQWGYVQQWNFDIQRHLPAGFFADVAYAGSHGVHLEQYQTEVNQLPDTLWSQGAALTNQVANPMAGTNPNPSLNTPTIAAGQLERPYPQYNQVQLAGFGCCSSSYNSLQASVTRRFQGGGTLLVAYTNAKLLSNTDTLTSWLEGPTGGVPGVQDWNNLKGERSLSAQDVSQRLVISYVLDLPFGHGKMFASNFTGFLNGAVSGWGVNGITTFQRGFPLKISYSGTTPLVAANVGVSNIRPDVVSGCDKKSGGGHITNWFNTTCFAAPPDYGPGTEARVDPTLRGPGINNFDFAIFKRTKIGERMGVEFRTEFFNIFNHPYFSQPATGFGAPGFGEITSTIQGGVASPERLVQFALKFEF